MGDKGRFTYLVRRMADNDRRKGFDPDYKGQQRRVKKSRRTQNGRRKTD